MPWSRRILRLYTCFHRQLRRYIRLTDQRLLGWVLFFCLGDFVMVGLLLLFVWSAPAAAPCVSGRMGGAYSLDVCKVQADDSNQKQTDYYFFSRKKKKYPTGKRVNRATAAGFWKATGRDKPIRNELQQQIGMRKTLVFHKHGGRHGIRTEWIMHEFRLDDRLGTPAHVSLRQAALQTLLILRLLPFFSRIINSTLFKWMNRPERGNGTGLG